MGIENDSILNLMREKKIEETKNKVKVSNTLKNVSVKETSTRKRIKQKSLEAIVAKKLKESNQSQSSVIQNELKVKPQINNICKDSQQKISKVEAYKNNSETSNKINDISNNPIISFTNITKENYGKTILARKRKVIDIDSKRTLSSIFSRQSEDVSLLNSLKKIQEEQSKKKDQKESKEESKKISSSLEKMNFDKKNKKKQIEKFKTDNDNNIEDDKNTHFSHKSFGKISSLFGHNPEIPNIGQRLVKPINEPIFTGTTFTDLNIHPFMVGILYGIYIYNILI